jgi:putative flippase GtrA
MAKFVTFLCGTVSSLLLNRSWTFGMKGRPSMAEVLRFYATVSVSLIINVEGMNILVSMGMYDILALFCTVGITFVANFLISKFWIFRPTSEREKEERPVLVS